MKLVHPIGSVASLVFMVSAETNSWGDYDPNQAPGDWGLDPNQVPGDWGDPNFGGDPNNSGNYPQDPEDPFNEWGDPNSGGNYQFPPGSEDPNHSGFYPTGGNYGGDPNDGGDLNQPGLDPTDGDDNQEGDPNQVGHSPYHQAEPQSCTGQPTFNFTFNMNTGKLEKNKDGEFGVNFENFGLPNPFDDDSDNDDEVKESFLKIIDTMTAEFKEINDKLEKLESSCTASQVRQPASNVEPPAEERGTPAAPTSAPHPSNIAVAHLFYIDVNAVCSFPSFSKRPENSKPHLVEKLETCVSETLKRCYANAKPAQYAALAQAFDLTIANNFSDINDVYAAMSSVTTVGSLKEAMNSCKYYTKAAGAAANKVNSVKGAWVDAGICQEFAVNQFVTMFEWFQTWVLLNYPLDVIYFT